MKKVFISSVIGGFEDRRAAARGSIEATGHQPVMAEEFGARSYSPERACLTEVSQSDVFLLIIGARYGDETDSGISATQAEYRQAKKLGLPILVFIEEGEKEPPQQLFCEEVEGYSDGFFRETYLDIGELKDEIVKGLIGLRQQFDAASEGDFRSRFAAADPLRDDRRGTYAGDAILTCAFWPQPTEDVDVVALEDELDSYFHRLCDGGLASLKDGYETLSERYCTGIKCGDQSLRVFEDGLTVYTVVAQQSSQESLLSSFFVSPARVTQLALGAGRLFSGNGAWVFIRLSKMEGKNFAEPHPGLRSCSTPMYSEDYADHAKLLIPYGEDVYAAWIKRSIRQFGRIFASDRR